jgi:hypothetical protein
MYTMLCGPAAVNELGHMTVGPVDRPRKVFTPSGWDYTINEYRAWSGKPYIGIPYAVQQRIWGVIKGIMGSCRNPQFGARELPFYIGGQELGSGQELFPVLGDLVLHLWRSGVDGRAGYGVDDDFFRYLSNLITDAFQHPPGCWTSTGDAHGTLHCTELGIDLGPKMVEQLGVHERDMRRAEELAKQSKPLIKASAVRGVLVLGARELGELARTEQAIDESRGMTADQRKAAIWTTSIVAGGGMLALARRIARKRRLGRG